MNELIIQYKTATSEIANNYPINLERIKVIQGKASRGDANNIANTINRLFHDNDIRFDDICQIVTILTTKWYHGHKGLKAGFSYFLKYKNISVETVIVNEFLERLRN